MNFVNLKFNLTNKNIFCIGFSPNLVLVVVKLSTKHKSNKHAFSRINFHCFVSTNQCDADIVYRRPIYRP